MTNAIYLVRHAKAGSRAAWGEDDALRPLVDEGRQQACLVAARLAPLHPPRLVSSPFLRCRQTLEPLAEMTSLAVESVDALREGVDTDTALTFLEALADGAVACSHGDVIPAVLKRLEWYGLDIVDWPDTRKGSVCRLERLEGRFVRAHFSAPPR
ncbi:MAG: histidine phosphatase family protein [Actinobacteria bacterium]|nr:histidine phosphatase family protein [Actinomycetota bacterium]